MNTERYYRHVWDENKKKKKTTLLRALFVFYTNYRSRIYLIFFSALFLFKNRKYHTAACTCSLTTSVTGGSFNIAGIACPPLAANQTQFAYNERRSRRPGVLVFFFFLYMFFENFRLRSLSTTRSLSYTRTKEKPPKREKKKMIVFQSHSFGPEIIRSTVHVTRCRSKKKKKKLGNRFFTWFSTASKRSDSPRNTCEFFWNVSRSIRTRRFGKIEFDPVWARALKFHLIRTIRVLVSAISAGR